MYKICHTSESSQWQRELEAGLLAALQIQPYEKITLTNLCRRLEIPRKSFYRYFPTKEDCLLALIDPTLSDCHDIALKGWNGSNELDKTVQLRFFQFWLDHSTLMGTTVYDAAAEGHVYCHSLRDGKDGYAYLIINNDLEKVITVERSGEAELYALAGRDGMRSSVMTLNGTDLIAGEKGELPALTGVTVSGTIEVAPGSCVFITV